MVEEIPLQMELDTGAGVSLLPHSIYRQRFLHVPLQKTNTRLRTYTGERIYPRGEIVVSVQKGQKRVRLLLVVVEGTGPLLLGRNWLAHIPINWQEINFVEVGEVGKIQKQERIMKLEELMSRYPKLWRETLGVAKGIKVALRLKEGAQPVFIRTNL